MKPFLLLLFSFLLSFGAQAQRINGHVLDAQNAPLAYVNIGVVGKDVGTVSSEKGVFHLTLPDSLNQETVQLSAIGYATAKMKVTDLKKLASNGNLQIKLQEEAVALREVVVRPRKFKTKVVGNETDSKTMMGGFKSNGLGSEVGTVLNINRPAYVDKITFNLAGNDYDTLFLRINVYKMGKNGPEENLLQAPIYVNVPKSKVEDFIALDVSKHNIYLETDALLSLELVKDLGQGGLWFSGGMFNSDSYYRKASQGDWNKIPILGLGFNATVSYAK